MGSELDLQAINIYLAPSRGPHHVRCGDCDNPLTACWSKGRSAHYAYYYCVAKGCESRSKMIRREKIEDEFETLLTKLTPPPVLIETATKMFKTW